MFLNDHFKSFWIFISWSSMGFLLKYQKKNEIQLLRYYLIFLFIILIISSIILSLIYFSNLDSMIYEN